MQSIVEPLLINFLFILFPIFLYHMLVTKNRTIHKKYYPLAFVLLASFSVVMCMEFGVELSEGYYYDMRQIPLILALLYGGLRMGLGVVCLSLLYRFYIGGPGFWVAVIFFFCILIIAAFISPKFKVSTLKTKIFISVSFTSFLQLILLGNFTSKLGFMPITNFDWISITIIQLVGMAFVNYIIETLIQMVKLHDDLVHTEKLKLVSELAASISHEVRNPLTVTRGFVQLLKDDQYPREKQEEFIDHALTEIDQANKIITDYLTFAKPELNKVERINVSDELTKTVTLIKPLTNMKGVNIKCGITEPVKIHGDEGKLQQCFMNIMKNAVDAMPNGGDLYVMLKTVDNHCIITFKDSGEGMTHEEVARLGTPYFSTKAQGTGLGMMVVFSLVKAMKGKIHISSEKRKGTSIELRFPVE